MTENSQADGGGGPTMNISEHLQELRSRMIKALIGVGVVLVACLLFQDEIMKIVTRPHRKAMTRLSEKIARDRAPAEKGEPSRTEKILSAIKKLKEKDPEAAAALEMLAREVLDFEEQTEKKRGTLKTLKYQEAFISYLKACIVAALILASPWILLQLWAFIGAGLYSNERKYVLTYLPFSFIAFGSGVTFGYFILIPEGLSYLATYANPELISVEITLQFYLSFFLLLTLALGAVFQLPLVMMFLSKAGVVTPAQYAKYRRYALLVAVIVGAILTPPDPVTQILLASPMFVLYELGIFLSRMVARKKKEAPE